MHATIRPASYAEDPLWVALLHYSIGPEDCALPFAARLARENGWSPDEAERVIGEYKRFCFLAIRSGHPVTPSDQIDQAWHLHLAYSRDYWERFCPDVLGRPLHHGPTEGGGGQARLYYDQYAETLKSYERIFGELPPADLWPDARRRFREDPRARRVHPRQGFFVTWRQAGLALLGASLAALAALLFTMGG
jgi:hypothetical protein